MISPFPAKRGKRSRYRPTIISDPSAPKNAESGRFGLTLAEVDEMAVLKVDEWLEIKDDKKKEEPSPPKVTHVSGDEDLVEKLLSKAADIETEEGDEKDFFKREKTLKPPVPGTITNLPFPGKPEDRKELTFDPKDLNLEEMAEALNVTRFTPEGRVGYPISRLRIAFDQPMVSVSGVDDVKEEFEKMGIKITPEAKGSWRWSGTKLLQFHSDARFRYSTKYEVTVPKGLKSALGGELEAARSFNFETPRVQIVSSSAFPHWERDPVVTITFNQEVDKSVVAKEMNISPAVGQIVIDLEGKSDEEVSSSLQDMLDKGDLKKESQVKYLKNWWRGLSDVQKKRSLCFRLDKTLKKGTEYTWKLPSGTVCGEGPLGIESAVQWSFDTYPSFKIKSHYPSPKHRYSSNFPTTPWSIGFSTALDRRTVTKSAVSIEPAITGVRVIVSGNSIKIDHDEAKIGTRYKVTIDKKLLRDKYGQKLEGSNSVVMKQIAKPPEEEKWGGIDCRNNNQIVTLDPFTSEKPELLLSVTNYEELIVTAYKIDDHEKIRDWRKTTNDKLWRDGKKPLGNPLFRDVLKVEASTLPKNRNKPQPFAIDVSKYFLNNAAEKLGRVFLTVEPSEKAYDDNHPKRGASVASKISHFFGGKSKYDRHRTILKFCLQRTYLSLDVFNHGTLKDKRLTAWVTDLRTGAPVEGAEVKHEGKTLAKTNKDGLATFELVHRPSDMVISAALPEAKDEVVARHSRYSLSGTGRTVWHTFDDRGLYKPNEEVTIKGYIRKLVKKGASKLPTYPTNVRLQYTIRDARYNEIGKGEVKALSGYGAFSITFKVPDNANTGGASVEFKPEAADSKEPLGIQRDAYVHGFSIQEFRRPEFSVSAAHRPSALLYSNPTKEDWDALAAADRKRANEEIREVIETLAAIREAGRQEDEDDEERKEKKRADEGAMDVEEEKTKAKGSLEAERKLVAKEEKETRERLKPLGFTFKRSESGDPCVIASVDAKYFAGGGLSEAEVRWTVKAKVGSYTPPRCSGYQFGKQAGWWWERMGGGGGADIGKAVATERFTGKTDGSGHSEVAVRWSGLRDTCEPLTIEASADVMDLNSQARNASTSFLVHPCRHYVGFKLASPTGEAGTPLEVDIVVVDPNGEAQSGVRVEAKLVGTRTARLRDEQGLDVWKTLKFVAKAEVVTEAAAADEAKDGAGSGTATPTRLKITPEAGGSHRLFVRVADGCGGWHQSESAGIYVSDPKNPEELEGVVAYNDLHMWRVPGDKVSIIPSAQEYNPGDTAKFVVRSAFSPASGLFVIDTEGLDAKPIPFEIAANRDSTEVSVVVSEEWIPGFRAQARVVGTRPREAGKATGEAKRSAGQLRQAYGIASLNLKVSRRRRTLDVAVVPNRDDEEVAPGKEVTATVKVTDYAGNPVPKAEVTLVVVDEAVLSLSGHSLQNPVGKFYPERGAFVGLHTTRNSVWLMPFKAEEVIDPIPEPDSSDDDSDAEEDGLMMKAEGMMAQFAAPRSAKRSLRKKMKKSLSGGMMRSRQARAYVSAPSAFGAPMSMVADKAMEAGVTMDMDVDMDEGELGLDNDDAIEVRKNFNALACFEPQLVTDEEGEASFKLKLPDSLTSYRVWAMAATDTLYGLGDSSLTVSLPLMVRPSPPRFMNFGDRAMVAVVVQNQTAKSLSALVAMRGNANAEVDQKLCAAKITLKPLQRGLIRFSAKAQKAGKMRLQIVSSTKGASDAAEVDLPVYTPATSEAFATYGSVDESGQDSDYHNPELEPTDLTAEEPVEAKKMQLVVQPVKPPTDAWPQFGGLEISTSTTQLQHLTDAVISLWDYTFECSEQLASRIMGILSVKDILEAFQCEGMPDAAQITAKVGKWLEVLYGRQASNGGWWAWGPPKLYNLLRVPSPYLSIHVSLCLALVEEKKLATIKPRVKAASLAYLRNIEARLQAFPLAKFWNKSWYNGIVAFALCTRTRWGDTAAASEAARFWKSRTPSDWRPEAIARMLVALSSEKREHAALIATLKKTLTKHITEEADTAYFTTSFDEVGQHIMLSSNRKTDALVLEGLLAVDDAKSALAPKICKGLLKHKLKNGSGWGSTQENCFVLMALLRYFHIFEKNVPDFKLSVWYGNLFGGVQEWKGRTTETKQTLVKMRGLMALGENNLFLHKEGPGRLYYRIGMSYAPKSLFVKASNYGFEVTRTYSNLKGKESVAYDEEKKVWKAKLGEKVKVTLTMTSTAKRYHVALVDFLPAGLEPLNPALKGSPKGDDEADSSGGGGRLMYNPYTYRCYSRKYWPEHINLRDERAEAFRSLLWPGIYEFTYTATATSLGEFVVPPAKAEEMYSPENFGRSNSERFHVVETL